MNVNSFTSFSVASILFYCFVLALFLQITYYLYYFSKLHFYKKGQTPLFKPPVSIIICARNEEKNLVNFLPQFLEQDYPEFEVVVVNHCSYDNTADILEEFAEKYKHLKVVTMRESQNHYHGKKMALMMGIKGAKNEHLLLSDADCKPKDNHWITGMMQDFKPDNEIVLGYGGYEKGKGMLNKIIRFDAYMIGLQYLSFALAGKPYMGIGRNVAYTKTLFYKVKGFASHYHLESGDDDLFINEATGKHAAKVGVNIEQATLSVPKKNIHYFFQQKRRHNTTFKRYTRASKRRLLLLTGSQYLFFATFILLLMLQFEPMVVISLFGIRVFVQLIIYKLTMKLLDEKDLLLYSPLLELTLLIIYPLITISNLFIKKNKWTN